MVVVLVHFHVLEYNEAGCIFGSACNNAFKVNMEEEPGLKVFPLSECRSG